jgi:hypothetical protein
VLLILSFASFCVVGCNTACRRKQQMHCYILPPLFACV